MKLTKENVYIDLRGKSKEELTDLWEFLKENNQETYNTRIESFLYDFHNTDSDNHGIEFDKNQWIGSFNDGMKTEVTIEQLKDILKPNLQTQLENAKKEVKRIEKLIEEDNKPKVGDWCKLWNDDKLNLCISKLRYINRIYGEYRYHNNESYYKNCEKITDSTLLESLNRLFK